MIYCDIEKQLQGSDGKMILNLKFEVKKGEFITLYGPSGAGKTSSFRILAGLMRPESGTITVKGNCWFDDRKKIDLKPHDRKIGFLFQDYALFPNMTVRENLEFALLKGQEKHIISDLIEIVELGELHNRYPATLSGGQQQRVALARALVQRPEILLLDEPLAALDLNIRKKLQNYLLKLHREFSLTTMLISHDLGEIFKLSDQLIVLEEGQITRQGTPSEIFTGQPDSGDLQLTGDILRIEKKGTIEELTILTNAGLIRHRYETDGTESLEVGDKVRLTAQTDQLHLYLIQ